MNLGRDDMRNVDGLSSNILNRLGYLGDAMAGEDVKYDQFGFPISTDWQIWNMTGLRVTDPKKHVRPAMARMSEAGAVPPRPTTRVTVKEFAGLDQNGDLKYETVSDNIEITKGQLNQYVKLIGEVKVNGMTWADYENKVIMNDGQWNQLLQLEKLPFAGGELKTAKSEVNAVYTQYKDATTLLYKGTFHLFLAYNNMI